MKTMQEIIRETDFAKIENAYFCEFPINLWKVKKHEDITIGEFNKRISERFQSFLQRLCDMEVESDGGVLFVHKSKDEATFINKDVALVHKDELLKEEDVSKVYTYSYEFTEQKKALGFLVADNKLTRDNLMTVIVSFLHEISFFGYEQEHLDEEIQRLNKAMEEYDNKEEHKTYTLDEIREEFGLPIEEEYPEEDELESRYFRAGHEYTMYCRNMELTKLKQALTDVMQHNYQVS